MTRNCLVLITLALFVLASCGKTEDKLAKNTTVQNIPTPALSPIPPKDGNYPGKGKVTKVNPDMPSVELNHEEIVGLMPAMIMEFFVKDKSLLRGINVGDEVEFVIEYKHPSETIVELKKDQVTSIKFCKFHGFGNDYIVIERENIATNVSLPDLAKDICDRHTGAGADGIAVLEPLGHGEADYFCEIVNPDGSIAGFSGNGTRCAVAYLYYKGLWSDKKLRLKTRSGVKNYRLLETTARGHYVFEAEIGKPRFASNEVPVALTTARSHVIDQQLTINNDQLTFCAVNVGNPVACVFVDDFDPNWRILGRTLETHSVFPDRANIVFVKVRDHNNIDIRIWERAAGETAASGTCASGSAVLSAFTQKTGRRVAVHSAGGTTNVLWRDDDEIVITGRADLAYEGEWPVQ